MVLTRLSTGAILRMLIKTATERGKKMAEYTVERLFGGTNGADAGHEVLGNYTNIAGARRARTRLEKKLRTNKSDSFVILDSNRAAIRISK